jgi:putative RecB family exonuclease
MIERFSYSSLETFKKCPAKFKFYYIDKIVKPDDSIEAFMGKRVHETLEFLYQEVAKKKIPIIDTVLEKYRELWEKSWHNRIAIFRWREFGSENYFALGEGCLARYYRLYKPFSEPVTGIEFELVFNLDDSDDYVMKGILDRVDHTGDGIWEIHDYKSGKRALTQKQADSDLQLALYQIGLQQLENNVESVILVWHFLQHGLEVRSTRTENQLNSLISKTKKTIDRIQGQIASGGEFAPKESFLCNWCYYWEECPAKTGTNPYIFKK